jgi:predicted ArsR family transcriptional regulator
MSPSPHTVLVETVDAVGESGGPVTASTVAGSLGASEAAVADHLDTLCGFDLLEATEEGYRPTVTGRELLALDVDLDDVFVLDVVEE